jgi:hypothetical protein
LLFIMASRILTTGFGKFGKTVSGPLAQNCYDNFHNNPNNPLGLPNEAVLLTTGLPLTKPPVRHTTLSPPTEFSMGDGTVSGTLCAKFKRPRYAAATEVRYTDDPSQPWYLWLSVTTTRSIATLRGYAKKTEVFVMCRAVGGDPDEQEFSAVLSRVVQ